VGDGGLVSCLWYRGRKEVGREWYGIVDCMALGVIVDIAGRV